MVQVFDRRALNRALLARQLLLVRADIPVYDAIHHLAGMQSQVPIPPYFGLWTRIRDFQPDELSSLIMSRRVIRIGLMRSTIHLVTDQDALSFRPLLQSVMDRGLQGSYGRQLQGADLEEIAEAGRSLVETHPRTFAEIGKLLQAQWPDRDATALANAVRNKVPLVQIPPRGLWGKSGSAMHTSLEAWLGQPLISTMTLDVMILRYLAAFGPARVQDIQTWSGLTKLQETVDRLLPHLLTFQDEAGHVLYDVPRAPRPAADTHAPVRFLGEFDNMLLSYADRSRIIADEYRTRVFTDNGIIRSTVLIDGFVQGLWRIESKKKYAVLTIEPFIPLEADVAQALKEEGMRLLAFAAPDAVFREIQGI